MSYKSLGITLGLLFSLWAGVFSIASAHELKTDGSISAIMHIDPNDTPVAGEASTLFFDIKDKQNQFATKNCDCRVKIFLADKQLYQALPFQNSAGNSMNSPVFSFTFPRKATYTVELSGSPINAEKFQPFSFTYNVRVDMGEDVETPAAPTMSTPTNHLFHYFILGGTVFIGLALYLYEKSKNKKILGKKNRRNKTPNLAVFAIIALSSFLIHGTMLDTALCFHDHPVMHDHQCCATPTIDSATGLSINNEVIAKNIEITKFLDDNKKITLRVSNKSPPVII